MLPSLWTLLPCDLPLSLKAKIYYLSTSCWTHYKLGVSGHFLDIEVVRSTNLYAKNKEINKNQRWRGYGFSSKKTFASNVNGYTSVSKHAKVVNDDIILNSSVVYILIRSVLELSLACSAILL